MKTIGILLVALAPLALAAQPAGVEHSLESQLGTHPKETATALAAGTKANEIVKGNVTYNGSVVEAFKVDHPLQLINPFAPATYGGADDNVLHEPMTGRPAGLNLFSIRF